MYIVKYTTGTVDSPLDTINNNTKREREKRKYPWRCLTAMTIQHDNELNGKTKFRGFFSALFASLYLPTGTLIIYFFVQYHCLLLLCFIIFLSPVVHVNDGTGRWMRPTHTHIKCFHEQVKNLDFVQRKTIKFVLIKLKACKANPTLPMICSRWYPVSR